MNWIVMSISAMCLLAFGLGYAAACLVRAQGGQPEPVPEPVQVSHGHNAPPPGALANRPAPPPAPPRKPPMRAEITLVGCPQPPPMRNPNGGGPGRTWPT